MRTNIDIDDDLMADAIATIGVRTKRDAVVIALSEAIARRRRARILELRGIGWEGDLDTMRSDIDP